MKYNFLEIEERWQETWEKQQTFATPNPGEAGFDPSKPRFYILDMFPYPSGVGLHVGHPLGYIATDILARYKRMYGYNVLHPMGYDAFGLPAENFAVENGVHPSVTTKRNIETITLQLRRLGLSYDWSRCLSTTDPEFYRWTQWIFLQMYNSWFDSSTSRARPIAELAQMLEAGEVVIDLEGKLFRAGEVKDSQTVRSWVSLSEREKDSVLSSQRLAYMDEVAVNWCPMLGTVLANEEVTNDGRSERGNYPIYRRPLRQWMLRITAYADRLADELDSVAWPDSIKAMQRNWIGRSEGAYVTFYAAMDSPDVPPPKIKVFTTRPDTLFGATYLVLAPEHPLVDVVTTMDRSREVDSYRTRAASRLDTDRQSATAGNKTGVFTGGYAINPINKTKLPIWIADYVLMGYGTGAIMAVPAHDDRDFAFALEFGLPMIGVVTPDEVFLIANSPIDSTSGTELLATYVRNPEAFSRPFIGEGLGIQSASGVLTLNGFPTAEAKLLVTDWLEAEGLGERAVQYKLRDWLFSRQRYWGEPFPILHGPEGEIVPLTEKELPVILPEMSDFTPVSSNDANAPPIPPLSRAPESWRYVTRNGTLYSRELNTMPQWAGSCWYYLRYIEPTNRERLVSMEAERYWMSPTADNPAGGVDFYVGGAEHAVLHLLYSRFWHKVLYDLGHVSTIEPFGRLFNQGYILAYSFEDDRGINVPATEVEERNGSYHYQGKEVIRKLGKMGKSLKNAVSPDQMIQQYGCDSLRLYEMYLGPLDQSKPWRTQDIVGVHRFLQRVWRLLIEENGGAIKVGDDDPSVELERLTHKTIKRVTQSMNSMAFNVAIAALIELTNELVKRNSESKAGGQRVSRAIAERLLVLLNPMAPHITAELWSLLGHTTEISQQPWPEFDPALIAEDEIDYPVQINGKLRHIVRVPADADETQVEAFVRADPKVSEMIAGKKVTRVFIVSRRLVSFVLAD